MKESKLKVLIADDHDAIEVLGKILRRKGLEIEISTNKEDFADKAERKDYDVILLDGEFCGNCYEKGEEAWFQRTYQTIDFLRKEKPYTKIIIFSAHREELVKEFVKNTDGYIFLGTDTEEIARLINYFHHQPKQKTPIPQIKLGRISYDPNWNRRDGD